MSSSSEKKLKKCLGHVFSDYFNEFFSQHDEAIEIQDMYQVVIKEVEKSLIQYIFKKSDYNQTKAAMMLGLNRNTLRKKLTDLKITTSDKKRG